MGDIQLHKHESGAQRAHDVINAFFHNLYLMLAAFLQEQIEMAETKFLLFIATLVGVPAFIYSWFINFGDIVWAQTLKDVIIAVIGISWGGIQVARLYIKMRNEYADRKFDKK